MDKEKEDRISLLPDCLLLEIISRIKIMDKRKEEERLMSTKEVIKTTTTISKRWQHLWTLLPSLVFIDLDDVTDLCYNTDPTDYYSFIDKTLTQCPTDVNLNKFKLHIFSNSLAKTRLMLQINSWIRHAITRNVQEVELNIYEVNRPYDVFSYDDELFFNNSCLISMKLSRCAFYPPNGAIRWDKLKFLCIDEAELDEDSIGEILSGSPCLETLELNHCYFDGLIPMSLFGNFGVLERLSCDIKTYERFSYGDELFLDDSWHIMSMKLSRCVFNPPNGTIGTDKLTFLCIGNGNLDEDSIGKILSGSPCLETLELDRCRGFRRIDVTSKSVKNLVLSGLAIQSIDTIEINAPYILSLTIKKRLCCVEKILLLNVSSLVKADLDYRSEQFLVDGIDDIEADLGYNFSEQFVGVRIGDIEEELLLGLLASLDHVNEIALGKYNCLYVFSRLEAEGFQFRKGSDRRINPDGGLVLFKQV